MSVDDSIVDGLFVGPDSTHAMVVAASIEDSTTASVAFAVPDRWEPDFAWLRDGLPVAIVHDRRCPESTAQCEPDDSYRLIEGRRGPSGSIWHDHGLISKFMGRPALSQRGILFVSGRRLSDFDLEAGTVTSFDLPAGLSAYYVCGSATETPIVAAWAGDPPTEGDNETEPGRVRFFEVDGDDLRSVPAPPDADRVVRCDGADPVTWSKTTRNTYRYDHDDGAFVDHGEYPESLGTPVDLMYSPTGITMYGLIGTMAHLDPQAPTPSVRTIPERYKSETQRLLGTDGSGAWISTVTETDHTTRLTRSPD